MTDKQKAAVVDLGSFVLRGIEGVCDETKDMGGHVQLPCHHLLGILPLLKEGLSTAAAAHVNSHEINVEGSVAAEDCCIRIFSGAGKLDLKIVFAWFKYLLVCGIHVHHIQLRLITSANSDALCSDRCILASFCRYD